MTGIAFEMNLTIHEFRGIILLEVKIMNLLVASVRMFDYQYDSFYFIRDKGFLLCTDS